MSAASEPQPESRAGRSRRRLLYAIGGAMSVLTVAIQLVPYGRAHDNPPVTQAVQWDSPRTEQLARVAFYDCHSNETAWPLYSNVAPMSWLVQRDVDQGRDELNLSERVRELDVDDAPETIRDGEMPPFRYTLAHPDARLSEQEKQELIDGFIASFGINDAD